MKIIPESPVIARVTFTMDTYSHIISGIQKEATVLPCDVLISGATRASHGTLKKVAFNITCQRSSGVEQRFRKPQVVGPNPTAGSR